MDTVERDLRTQGGLSQTATARAAGLRTLCKDADIATALAERGLDLQDAEALEQDAKELSERTETGRQMYAALLAYLAETRAAATDLAELIRSTDDAARAALGRKSEKLYALGIRPAGKRRTSTPETK